MRTGRGIKTSDHELHMLVELITVGFITVCLGIKWGLGGGGGNLLILPPTFTLLISGRASVVKNNINGL